MPQLDFTNILTISQIVWMALIFGAFYLLLSNWALPKVGQVIDDRAARITADLDTAHLSKVEADDAVRELQAAIKQASTESQAAIAASIAKAKNEAADQARQANQELDTQLAQAEQRIAAARSSAMGALREVATETASAMVTRLTNGAANLSGVGPAVDTAIAARG